MADGRHIEDRFWLYDISASYWPINAKFGMEMKLRCLSSTCRYRCLDQNDNFRKFKMVDGRHFVNSFSEFRHIRYSCNEFKVIQPIQ